MKCVYYKWGNFKGNDEVNSSEIESMERLTPQILLSFDLKDEHKDMVFYAHDNDIDEDDGGFSVKHAYGVKKELLKRAGLKEGILKLREAKSELKLDSNQTLVAQSLLKWAVKQPEVSAESSKENAIVNWGATGEELIADMQISVNDNKGYTVTADKVAVFFGLVDWARKQPEIVNQSGNLIDYSSIASDILYPPQDKKPSDQTASAPEVNTEPTPPGSQNADDQRVPEEEEEVDIEAEEKDVPEEMPDEDKTAEEMEQGEITDEIPQESRKRVVKEATDLSDEDKKKGFKIVKATGKDMKAKQQILADWMKKLDDGKEYSFLVRDAGPFGRFWLDVIEGRIPSKPAENPNEDEYVNSLMEKFGLREAEYGSEEIARAAGMHNDFSVADVVLEGDEYVLYDEKGKELRRVKKSKVDSIYSDVDEAKDARGKRDGSGPYKKSAQKKVSDVGKRKQAGQKCVKEEIDIEEAKSKITISNTIKDLKKELIAFRKAGDREKVKDLQDEINQLEAELANIKESKKGVEEMKKSNESKLNETYKTYRVSMAISMLGEIETEDQAETEIEKALGSNNAIDSWEFLSKTVVEGRIPPKPNENPNGEENMKAIMEDESVPGSMDAKAVDKPAEEEKKEEEVADAEVKKEDEVESPAEETDKEETPAQPAPAQPAPAEAPAEKPAPAAVETPAPAEEEKKEEVPNETAEAIAKAFRDIDSRG